MSDADFSSLSHAVRRRFTKDHGLPIQIVQDPYFGHMLDLFEPFFGCRSKLALLLDEVRDCGSEDAFFSRSDRLIDTVCDAIQATESYQRFSQDDLDRYTLDPSRYGSDSLYHPDNDGRAIIAVDLVKANYQALRYHDPALVLDTFRYAELVSRFTDRPYHRQSKPIRQVIFGRLQPKKQQRIQRWIVRHLMDKVAGLRGIGGGVREVSADEFAVVSNDRAALEGFVVVTSDARLERDLAAIREALAATPFEYRATPYRLHQLAGTSFYVKVFFDGRLPEPKCVPSFCLPQVLRHLTDQPIRQGDLVFFHEGFPAQYRRPVLQGYEQDGEVWRRAI